MCWLGASAAPTGSVTNGAPCGNTAHVDPLAPTRVMFSPGKNARITGLAIGCPLVFVIRTRPTYLPVGRSLRKPRVTIDSLELTSVTVGPGRRPSEQANCVIASRPTAFDGRPPSNRPKSSRLSVVSRTDSKTLVTPASTTENERENVPPRSTPPSVTFGSVAMLSMTVAISWDEHLNVWG